MRKRARGNGNPVLGGFDAFRAVVRTLETDVFAKNEGKPATSTQRFIAWAIARRMDRTGSTFVSVARLGLDTGFGRSAVQEAICVLTTGAERVFDKQEGGSRLDQTRYKANRFELSPRVRAVAMGMARLSARQPSSPRSGRIEERPREDETPDETARQSGGPCPPDRPTPPAKRSLNDSMDDPEIDPMDSARAYATSMDDSEVAQNVDDCLPPSLKPVTFEERIAFLRSQALELGARDAN